jgi:membrane protease YdiL (CAAX protease family)
LGDTDGLPRDTFFSPTFLTKTNQLLQFPVNQIAEPRPDSTWRPLHGGVFLALFLLLPLTLPFFLTWPWVWLAPLAGYLIVVSIVPPLRRTFAWPRCGRIDWSSTAATAILILLTSAVLVLYQVLAQPDVTALRASLPFAVLGGVVLAGVVFAVLNATLEELVFRGVLFDALASEWGGVMAVMVTAVLFGLGHRTGYPPGPVGVCLAGLYGLALGLLRLWVGGLALPILAHIAADATIYALLIHAGTP